MWPTDLANAFLLVFISNYNLQGLTFNPELQQYSLAVFYPSDVWSLSCQGLGYRNGPQSVAWEPVSALIFTLVPGDSGSLYQNENYVTKPIVAVGILFPSKDYLFY